MSAKQAKFFGKMKKKAVKENVNLSREQNVLKENIKNILQKNGLADLVTPKILRSMLEAFALGRSVNEAHSEKEKLQIELNEIKKSLAKDENKEHDNSHLIKRMQEIKNKLKGPGYMSKGD